VAQSKSPGVLATEVANPAHKIAPTLGEEATLVAAAPMVRE